MFSQRLTLIALLVTPFLFGGGNCFAADLLDCTYIDNTPTAELEPHAGCARRIAGQLRVDKDHLARMSFTTRGLGWLWVSGQYYYVKRDGSTLPVVEYDNGPDYFADGLVRSRINGRVAYYDSSFRQVIPPLFDWGWPFENGLAWVCRGCKEGPHDAEGHYGMVGGLWGRIDKSGREVVPVTLTDAQAAELTSQSHPK